MPGGWKFGIKKLDSVAMAETFTPGKVKQKVVVLAAHPKGMVKESDMRVEEQEIELAVKEGSGDVVLKVMDISLDPYYRELMQEEDTPLGIPMFKIGQVCQLNLLNASRGTVTFEHIYYCQLGRNHHCSVAC